MSLVDVDTTMMPRRDLSSLRLCVIREGMEYSVGNRSRFAELNQRRPNKM